MNKNLTNTANKEIVACIDGSRFSSAVCDYASWVSKRTSAPLTLLHNIERANNPTSSNIVMITTVVVVVWTHNLAYGGLAGVLLAALFFANKAGHIMYVSKDLDEVGY